MPARRPDYDTFETYHGRSAHRNIQVEDELGRVEGTQGTRDKDSLKLLGDRKS